MRIVLSVLLCLSLFHVMAQSDEAALERGLYNLPNVTFKKVSAPGDQYLKYELVIRQPLDHWHPEKGYFYQHATLLHKGFSRPTVIETQGYWLYDHRDEVEKMLETVTLRWSAVFIENKKCNSAFAGDRLH